VEQASPMQMSCYNAHNEEQACPMQMSCTMPTMKKKKTDLCLGIFRRKLNCGSKWVSVYSKIVEKMMQVMVQQHYCFGTWIVSLD